MKMKRFFLLFLLGVASVVSVYTQAGYAQTKSSWREATPAELEAFLPARAPVEGERIETEMRTASGIINGRGQMVAGVVLITAGYAAQGKYTHYLLSQSTLTLGDKLALAPGAYAIGWQHTEKGLRVHVNDAATGAEKGTVLAVPITQFKGVESIRIWALPDRRVIQIGRFMVPYAVKN